MWTCLLRMLWEQIHDHKVSLLSSETKWIYKYVSQLVSYSDYYSRSLLYQSPAVYNLLTLKDTIQTKSIYFKKCINRLVLTA